MIDTVKFLKPYKEHFYNLRENLKKEVQRLIDEKKINYEQAIRILENSKLFEIEDFIISDGIFDVYTDYVSDFMYVNRGETIYFSRISDWINDNEEKEKYVKKAYKDKDINREDLQKEIYDTIVDNNIVGFKFDW